MQAIENAQRNMFALIKSYNITMVQRTGPFRARKAVIADAITQNPQIAIQIFQTTDAHEAFDRSFDTLSTGVEREAIRLVATNDSGDKTKEAMRFYSNAKTAILAAYRLPSDNYVVMLDAITENPERLSGINYPSWMQVEPGAPIAAFMVFNRVRNLFAHPENLESTLRYNKTLWSMYEQLKQDASETSSSDGSCQTETSSSDGSCQTETSSNDGSCQTDEEPEWVMPCIDVSSRIIDTASICIPMAVPIDQYDPVKTVDDQCYAMHGCQTLTAAAESMLSELELFMSEELGM